jgi:hypothetical protein
MEPVFMMTSQSAGTAAAFAIDDNVPVQQVNYSKLAAQLLADGQILKWGSVQSIGTNGIIMTVTTTPGVTKSSGWTAGSNSGGWPLPNGTYLYDASTNSPQYVRFNPTITTNGYYDVYIWWVYASNRATNTPVIIASASATNTVLLNQQINCTDWVKIASSNYFNIGTSGSVTITNGGSNGYISGYAVANAVRFMPLGSIAPNPEPVLPVVQVVASDAEGGEFGPNPARFAVVCPNGTNGAPLTVNYSLSGTATPGVDYAALPASVTLAAGVTATNIYISPLGNNLSTNQITVTINLAPSPNYTLTNLATATAVILDHPSNNWLRDHFATTELADPAISGDAANPAGDGLPNLLKYSLGLDPHAAQPNPFVPASSHGLFTITYPISTTAPDVALGYDWSTNLIDWFAGSNAFQVLNISDQVTNQIITIGTATGTPNGFIRFNATRR